MAEEIESLGKAQRHELASRISIILVHLLKRCPLPSTTPRGGGRETISAQRNEVERLLEDSPSLRRSVEDIVAKVTEAAAHQAALAIAEHDEAPLMDLGTVAYTAEQVLGDWFPG